MEENSAASTTPAPPTTPTTIGSTCQAILDPITQRVCNTSISLPFPPLPIFNSPIVSTLIIPHLQGVTCPSCGQYYALCLMDATVALALLPADRPILNEDRRVLPFSIVPRLN